jgi:phosphonoacetaldehyde hydrolase
MSILCKITKPLYKQLQFRQISKCYLRVGNTISAEFNELDRLFPKSAFIQKQKLSSANDKKKLQLLVGDGSGTLVDAGVYAPAIVFQKVFDLAGVPITMSEARLPMGNHKRVHIQKILENPTVSEKWYKVHGHKPTDKDVTDLFDKFQPLQLDVLAEYGGVITGALDACKEFKRLGLYIGFTTGFTREMVDRILYHNPKLDICLDHTVAADEVSVARPAPFMIYKNMEALKVINPHLVVKVDDTELGMEEGVHADCWRIGLAKYSNLMGMTEKEVAEFERTHPFDYCKKIDDIYKKLYSAGAHYVVNSITDVPKIVKVINTKLSCGDRP